MEAINIDLVPGKANAVCHVSQYDVGRTVRCNLFELGSVYTLAGTETITVDVRKPDGNIVTASVTNTSSTYVEIVTTQQMDAVAGRNVCELSIVSGGDTIGTANFYMDVELDPLDGGTASESFIYNLQSMVNAAVLNADIPASNVVIPDTASSTIATFTTSLAKPLVACEVDQNATKLIHTSGNASYAPCFMGLFLGTHNFVDLGSLTWALISATGGSKRFGAAKSDLKLCGNNDIPNMICIRYPTVTPKNTYDNVVGISADVNSHRFTCYDSSFNDDVDAFKSAMSGVYIIYELETPTTPTITEAQFNTLCTAFGIDGDIYDLPVSPLPTTYQGTNNFFTDYNASVSLTYLETIKEYIDKRVTP